MSRTTGGSGNQTYYLSDALGSMTDRADGKPNSVAPYTYDVLGAIRAQIGSSSRCSLFAGATRLDSVPWRFLDSA